PPRDGQLRPALQGRAAVRRHRARDRAHPRTAGRPRRHVAPVLDELRRTAERPGALVHPSLRREGDPEVPLSRGRGRRAASLSRLRSGGDRERPGRSEGAPTAPSSCRPRAGRGPRYALGSDPTTLTNDTHSPGAPPRLWVSASFRPRSTLLIW